jgi:hypothetical protein
MNQGSKPASSPSKDENLAVFSASESAGVVIAYATMTGRATVVDAHDQPQIIISIPTKDLPPLGD